MWWVGEEYFLNELFCKSKTKKSVGGVNSLAENEIIDTHC